MAKNIIKTEFNFKEHATMALEKYRKVKPLYDKFTNLIKKTIEEACLENKIKIHSVQARTKSLESLGLKASLRSNKSFSQPKYKKPLEQITDLAGVRIITYFPKTISEVEKIINKEFKVLERIDKGEDLLKKDKFGYQGVHFIVKLRDKGILFLKFKDKHPEFKDLVAEIQVMTILQHTWAEIEHDIQYKSIKTIPLGIRRRFISLAGLLETADREFQVIQDEDERLRKKARKRLTGGELEKIEITAEVLKIYLDNKLGLDDRVSNYSYNILANDLIEMGFKNLAQIDQAIKNLDDDKISKILWGSRQGQISRFEDLLLTGMGENYIKSHPLSGEEWFNKGHYTELEKLREAGVKTEGYNPKADKRQIKQKDNK